VSSERGQALVELALGLPLIVAASLYSFALLDAASTQEAVQSAARRAATVIAGSNDDAQATGAAARTPWLRGQLVTLTATPNGTQRRCSGTAVTLAVSAPGHLGFLLLVPSRWSATVATTVEGEGAQAAACATP
jgi:Flp pilus assembly protein TadG